MSLSLCCVFNYGPSYRSPVYELMDRHWCVDFYFGSSAAGNIKKMDYALLKGFVGELDVCNFWKGFYWQRGVLCRRVFLHRTFIFTGDPFCISTWVFLFLARLTNRKVFLWTHGWYGREGRLKRLLKCVFFKLSAGVFVYNDRAKLLMERIGFDSSRVCTVYNSLAYEQHRLILFKGLASDVYFERFGNRLPVLIFLGRVQQVKRIDVLLDSIVVLKRQGFFVNCIVVGADVDGVDLEKMVAQRGLMDSVWLYGPCYDETQNGEFLYNADLCVSPGNVGLTAIHALTFGCPVITHSNLNNQMPEFEAIKPGISGEFFKENDASDLAKVIKNWIRTKGMNRERVRADCYEEIERRWNPAVQVDIIKKFIWG